MSRSISILTVGLLAMPVVLLAAAIFRTPLLAAPALCATAIYLWIWLRFRPTMFVVRPDVLEIDWPLKRREIRRGDISDVRLIDRRALRSEIGWGMRIGAGGLWGGFGCLWTTRRGLVQMYISRIDRFVWIERPNARPLLITPEQPEIFVRCLSSSGRAGSSSRVD